MAAQKSVKGMDYILPMELEFPHAFHADRYKFEEVDVPVITISATYRSDIAEKFEEELKVGGEAVFSRAHYSMALGVSAAAKEKGLSAWLVDPTNYVSPRDWRKVSWTEMIGELIARTPILKKAKDLLDTFLRSKLPIAGSVAGPLKHIVKNVKSPIISLHYESGNLIAPMGKKVIQVVTDPHVRPNYLLEAQRDNIVFAVFDQQTKKEFLHKAKEMKKSVSPKRVVVTGPPVDPRIVKARKGKEPDSFKKRGLRLAITTGGLGTNKGEIEEILKKLLPAAKEKNISLILYAGTHPDFREMFYRMPEKYNVEAGDISTARRVRVIYDESIVTTNQELIKYAFPWADGFVTKPSGDMAYDAVAAGCFLLTLQPWGEWEENIQKIFTKLNIAKKARCSNFLKQLDELSNSEWIGKAIRNALEIDDLYLEGAEKIVDLQQKEALQ